MFKDSIRKSVKTVKLEADSKPQKQMYNHSKNDCKVIETTEFVRLKEKYFLYIFLFPLRLLKITHIFVFGCLVIGYIALISWTVLYGCGFCHLINFRAYFVYMFCTKWPVAFILL